MTSTGLNAAGVLAGIESVLQAVGGIEQVVTSQSTNPPTDGIGAQVWAGPIKPVGVRSGLASVSVLTVTNIRLTMPLATQPPESIDPALLTTLSDVMNALAGGFTLDGEVAQVDLLGQYGVPMDGIPGYVDYAGVGYRCITLTVPAVLDDIWTEAP